MMILRATLLAGVAVSALALTTASAQAQTASPLYISLFGGGSFLTDVKNTGSTGTPAPIYTTRTNMGYILGGAIGTNLSDNIRAEVEVSHSNWGINALDNNGGGFGPASGNFSATYVMGNVWYDFHNNSMFTPYVGGGVGAAFPHEDLLYKGDSSTSDTPTALAFQLGLGAKVALASNVDLDIGYRLKDIPNFNLNVTDKTGTYAYNGYNMLSHNIQAGLTFHF